MEITLKGFIKLKINAVVGFLDAQSKVQNKSGVDADASQLKCTMASEIAMDSQTLRVLLLGLLRLKVLVKWVITATYPEIRVNKY